MQIDKKRLPLRLAMAIVPVLVLACAFIGAAGNSSDVAPDYVTEVFGKDIISIEIIADDADWQTMLDNAVDEEYIKADVVVNGTKFVNVGVRPKGNSSLAQVAGSDSDRFSFRFQFDKYDKDQTCFGLDSFVVNNMYADNTYMKEYLSYELMKEIGVAAPLFGYASISVNGKNWGLYLAVERYSKSYENRVFNTASGMLYNVKTMEIGGDQRGEQAEQQWKGAPSPSDGLLPQMPVLLQNPQFADAGQIPPAQGGLVWPDLNLPLNESGSAAFPRPDTLGNRMDAAFANIDSRTSSGGSLEYKDDDTASYSDIFDNVVGKGADSDFKRVVLALKALSEERELEKYFDIDGVLRYLAAHTIVVNLDSYSSNMAQNYFIYEREGRLSILPWDYNLAWGGFQSGNAASVINFPIDTPVSGVSMSSRPLIGKLFSNAEYLARYHGYLQQLIDECFADGRMEQRIIALDRLISDYVEKDPTAFCSYKEYKKAVDALITLANLRAQSIQGQLNGTIPSTSQGQGENADKLVPAGELKLSDLGSMMGVKGGNAAFPVMVKSR